MLLTVRKHLIVPCMVCGVWVAAGNQWRYDGWCNGGSSILQLGGAGSSLALTKVDGEEPRGLDATDEFLARVHAERVTCTIVDC